MSGTFVNQLRTRGGVIDLASPGGPAITIRVEMPEVWDVVRMAATPNQPVIEVKTAALHALYPEGAPDEMVIKLRGWEILDETASLADCNVVDGSILLLMFRRRRPVR